MWEKKVRHDDQKNGEALLTATFPIANTPEVPTLPTTADREKSKILGRHMTEISASQPDSRTALGHSVVINGDLSGNEDLLIEGEFEGNIRVEEHCLTVG